MCNAVQRLELRPAALPHMHLSGSSDMAECAAQLVRWPRAPHDTPVDAPGDADGPDPNRPDPVVAMRLDLTRIRDWTEAVMSWDDMEPRVRRMLTVPGAGSVAAQRIAAVARRAGDGGSRRRRHASQRLPAVLVWRRRVACTSSRRCPDEDRSPGVGLLG
ncbi:hypothetical protein GCM10022220_65810 [Actinocatenispora rupis]|uniref:Uncharacterized protein n=1 Tax=Actinocatenispora rupis TaxID=519421 RepID=A0A8J3NGJ7_9ACTN|nr:hypothetical protein Aru02nite_69140 [Actinocatenispora rupis]